MLQIVTMENSSPYVLIVDDDPDVCEMYAAILGDAGFHALAAHDGAAALSFLAQTATNPFLIILDLVMPEMGGRAFRSIQRTYQSIAAIPTVIVTGSGSDNLSLPHDPELVGVLTKPISPDVLVGLARTHCHKY
jgi:CheY-like chemotaxis protein